MKKALGISVILVLSLVTLFVCYQLRHHVKKAYGANGNVEKEMEFNNGMPNGYGKQYYPSGKLKTILNFKEGKKHGKAIFYYESGKIRKEQNYKEDSLDGPSFIYFEGGQKMSENVYSNGRIISGGSFTKAGDSISVHRGNVIRTYGGGKIYVLDCLASMHKNKSAGTIKFDYKGEIVEYKGPLTCLTKNDSMLLDERNPEWRKLKADFKE